MTKRINGGGPAGQELDERAAKRRKLPIENIDQTAEITTQHGLELLEIIKNTTDKNGRIISTNFLTLPNKRLVPEYYQVIKMPIALDTIEAKLKRQEFPDLTTLEGYFKRMILNAKQFNETGSITYEDSERLRKVVSNYMTKHNPAYKTTPGFVALATPILAGENRGNDGEISHITNPDEQFSKKSVRISKNSLYIKPNMTPTTQESRLFEKGFDGHSFQQAQEKIVEDMINVKEWEEDDFGAFEPFINLPSRKEYKDYYNVITHPLALTDLQRAVKGIRAKTPGVSEFNTWSAFEEEAAHIWKNAFLYNEDNSDIFKLAIKLRDFFYKLLRKAKAVVPEPTSTKIKLRMPEPTKITLKIGRKSSPNESHISQPVPQITGSQQTTNGINTRNLPATAITTSSIARFEGTTSLSKSDPSTKLLNPLPLKNEDKTLKSPKLKTSKNNINSSTSLTMQTPTSSSLTVPTNSITNASTAIQSNIQYHGSLVQSSSPQSQPDILFNSKFRLPGKTAADAMITNLSIASHPGLNITRHFRIDIPPSATLAKQFVTINLPASHYYLQIKPLIASSMMQRQHKLFVTAGTTRLHAMPTIPGHPVEPRNPLFEARLHPGVNRIEIEIVAAFPKGTTVNREFEMEKINLFLNLMRA